MNSKYKLLASNTIVFAIGNVLVKLISFFLMPLYTSVLTTEQYGIAELLNNAIEIVLPIATLCVIEALYRFSIDEDVDRCTLFMNSFIIILAGDIVVVIGTLILQFIFDYEYALYFALLFVTATFYKLVCQFARGLGHVKRYVFYGIVNSIILVVSNVILLVWLHGGIAAYLTSFSIGYGLSGLLAFLMSREYVFLGFGYFNLFRLKTMLQYSLPSIPNMLSWWVNSLSDRYIVLMFWGAGSAGLYTVASKLPAMMNLVTSIFQQAWQYSAAIEIKSTDNIAFFSNVFRGYTYFCFVVCTGLVLVNKLICRVLLMEDFYIAWKYVPLLLFAATFGCVGTYFGTFYNAIKNNKMLMFSTLIGAMVNIVLNFLLIPVMRGMGAAIATTVSYLLIMSIRMIDVSKFINIEINIKRFLSQIVVMGIAVITSLNENWVSTIVPGICLVIIMVSDVSFLQMGFTYIKTLNSNKYHKA